MGIVNQVYLLVFSFVRFYTALQMSRCSGWEACQTRLLWRQCADWMFKAKVYRGEDRYVLPALEMF